MPAHCLTLGCWEAAQRGYLTNLFIYVFLNHGEGNNTDGRYSPRGPWKVIARKGEDVEINDNCT